MRSCVPVLLALLLAVGTFAPSCSREWDPGTGPGGGGQPLPASLLGIGVTPNNPTVTLGEVLQFRATGFYSDQTTRDVTDTVTWLSASSSVIEVSGSLDSEGVGETVAPGKTEVRAEFFEIVSNTVTVTVTEAQIETLTISPPAATLHVGEEVPLTAEATFSDGSRGNVTGSVRWVTDSGAVATVAAGVVTGVAEGATSIQAIYVQGGTELPATPAVVEVVGGDVTIEEADVRIVGLSVASSAAGVVYTVELKNSGGSSASSFWTDVWVNRTAAPPPAPTTGDAYEFVDVLEPGATTEIAIEVDDVPPGNYESWVLADSFANVAEGSLGENNNLWGPEPVSVSGSGGPIGPDLSITYLQAYLQAEQVLYILDVTNTGDQAAPAFDVGVFSNPGFPPSPPATADEEAPVAGLGAGETVTVTLTIRVLPTSIWQSYVLADLGDDVDEPNESNNLSAFTVVP